MRGERRRAVPERRVPPFRHAMPRGESAATREVASVFLRADVLESDADIIIHIIY